MKLSNAKQTFTLLILGFTAAAVGGWLYEEICVYVMYHDLYNRGMLHLTLCPIYGFGAWGLALLLRKIKHPLPFFLLSTIIASVFEYACSYLLEFLFHRSFWSYADWILSVDERISLISSLIFGMLAVLFAFGILPFLRRHIHEKSCKYLFPVSIALLLLIAGDFVLVLIGF